MYLSKELLSEILQKEVVSIETTMFGHFNISLKNDYGTEINRYQLAHKCKEWAKSLKCPPLGYTIESSLSTYSGYKDSNAGGYRGNAVIPLERKGFFAPTEPEAVFKATQWILDQKDNT
jgi:hypothetical protein